MSNSAVPNTTVSDARPTDGRSADVERHDDDPSSGNENRPIVRTDAQGRKWLGDVPYDVFFDDPLAVAAEDQGANSAGGGSNAGRHEPPGKPEVVKASKAETPASARANRSSPAADQSTSSKNDWNRLVDIDVLDAEVKRIRNQLTADLQSVSSYNGHYQEIAVAGATLAAVAEIVGEHSGSLSWKNNAGTVRDLGTKIHDAASKPGSPACQATKAVAEQLVDVLDGNSAGGTPQSPSQRDFADVADRNGVMKRMERSFQSLKKGGSGSGKKESGSGGGSGGGGGEAMHEALLLAAFARVIAAGHYESADDPKYKAHANELSKSAAAAAEALKADDAAAFGEAVSRVQKRCDACHADFRFQ